MRLPELQNINKKAKKLRTEGLLESWKDINQVLSYQSLLYVLKVICLELISRHHNDCRISYFDIEKTQELIARKYYLPKLHRDIEAYDKGCNIYLVSKVVYPKPYRDLQLLFMLTHW